MPTWNRREYVPAAIDCFLKQSYETRELVILDDGEEEIRDLIPDDPRIHYHFEDKRRITGDKRNRVNELAQGEIICHWDDDDWSAETRIEDQVARLQESEKQVTGYSVLYFWNVTIEKAFYYKAQRKGYVCGTTLCYYKKFWETRKYRHRHEATDNDFVYPIINRIAACTDPGQMVARIHNCHHTSRKNNIRQAISKDHIPAAFWKNEKMRLKTK